MLALVINLSIAGTKDATIFQTDLMCVFVKFINHFNHQK